MSRTLAALLAAALLASAPGAAAAAEPRTSLPDVEDEVMCVTCGVALNIAESPQADRQRAFIRDLVDRGHTKAQIKDALVVEYGERVLGMPRDEGFGLAAYLVPALAVAALVGGLALLLPRWRRRAAAPPVAGPALTSADERRLDDELARLDR